MRAVPLKGRRGRSLSCTAGDEVLPQELQHGLGITRSMLFTTTSRLSLAMKIDDVGKVYACRAAAGVKLYKAMDERTSKRETWIADALTEKVLQAYSEIDNVRLRGLVACLIRHLHAFVKEAKPTDKEFETGWTLLAEMAKFTSDERNEFLLFCDVTGVSELVEKINHVRPQPVVGFSQVGPFYRANAPILKRGESIASDDTNGDRVRITGVVSDPYAQDS